MAEDHDIDLRLADEVTSLSTKLVTEVAKSSQLEETILMLRRESASMKTRLAALESVETEYKAASEKLVQLQASHVELTRSKLAAEAKNKQLEGEVEDLTASLFNEANEMVSNASREAYNFKLKNRKLIEELGEKDSIIDNLQDQLRDLKDLFVKMEDNQRSASRANTPRVEHGRFEFDGTSSAGNTDDLASSTSPAVLQQLLYGLRGRAVRFDLPAYQLEFKAFVCQLIKPGFVFDLASLKTLKYFRKLWTEEIEPCVPVIPALTGNTFMNRWSKGKSFWSLLVEGKAIIEPVAGVNETFKLTYKGAKRGDEVPVAVKDACAFCGEHKDDLLEHARLYNLKLYGPATETGSVGSSTTEIGGEPHTVIGTYALCNFCLVKLRAICTFFARLRLVHSNIYKLPQNSTFDDLAHVNSFQFKRSSESLQTPAVDRESEPVFVKLYLMILVLRAKIFWSRVGFWDTEEDVEFLNLDEIPLDVFRAVVQDNVAFKEPETEAAPQIIAQKQSHDVDTTETQHIGTDSETVTKPASGLSSSVIAKESTVGEKDPEEEIDEYTNTSTDTTAHTLDPASKQEAKLRPEPVQEFVLEGSEVQTPQEAEDLTPKSAGTTEPKSEEPKSEEPKTEEPKSEEPKSEEPKSEEPKSEEPKTEESNIGEPKTKKNKKKGKKGKRNEISSTVEPGQAEQTMPIAPTEKLAESTGQIRTDIDDDGDSEFQDSVDTFEAPPNLQRRKSKSKEFKAKMNKDLDQTLAALQESLE